MKIAEQSYEILTPISEGGIAELQRIELAGRTCYKSESKISPDGNSAKTFCKMLIDHGHEAMIEHSNLTVKFTTDRGVTHELVRHRVASYAQESTRYCNYHNGKFGGLITVIKPVGLDEDSSAYQYWYEGCKASEDAYFDMLIDGVTPEVARSVLPTCLKAEIVISANYREWRNILRLRTAPDAHPQIRALLIPFLEDLKKQIPIIFDDIAVE